MTKTYEDRNILAQPSKGSAAGFVIEDRAAGTETLYALIGGTMLKRTDILGCDEFNIRGADWRSADSIPAAAEWIGNYPGPYRYDRTPITELNEIFS